MTTSPSAQGPDNYHEKLINSLGGIVWEADPQTFQITYVSPRAEAMLGYSPRDWYDDPGFWVKHTHPDDVEWCAAFCKDAIAKERDHEFEYRMIAADGRTVWMRDVVTYLRDEDGTARLRGIMLDITKRKRAEEELRRSEARYRSLVQATSHAIWSADAQGHRHSEATLWRQITGQTQDEIAKDGWANAVHPDDRERVLAAWKRSLTEGVLYEQEYRVRAADGSYRIVSLHGAPVRDDDGKVVEWVGTYNDVTEHRETAAQLLQSQKMDSLGRLAGGVAHDFNNLLTVMLGYTDFLIGDRRPEDPVRQDAEEIRRAAKQASLLTQQLLAFSRKELREPVVMDLNQRVRESSTMLRRLIGEQITLELELSADAGGVLVDPGQIDQILMNLVVNARDAMPTGGAITILTDFAPVSEAGGLIPPGAWTRLVVADTGAGMSGEVLAHAFEPFYTTKKHTGGTGLGLATVYGLVRQAGGFVSLDSEPGHGTIVTILLPRHAVGQDVVTETRENAGSGRETVLLVEDEDAVRRLAKEILERRGYHVLAAACGQEALEVAKTHKARVDLVLTDVVMPGMSGSEVAHRLIQQRPEIRVLYMSGYADDAILRHGVQHGSVNFIQKPFSPDALSVKVREVLDRVVSPN